MSFDLLVALEKLLMAVGIAFHCSQYCQQQHWVVDLQQYDLASSYWADKQLLGRRGEVTTKSTIVLSKRRAKEDL